MKEYLKKFIFFIVLSFVAAIIFRMAFPKTINVRVIGITGISGAVDANVSGSVDTETKVKF